MAFVGAGACAGLVGQAIGLGLLEWPPGGLPGFPWWEPPAAYASPGAGAELWGPRTDELLVGDAAWLMSWSVSGEQRVLLPAGRTSGGPGYTLRYAGAGPQPASSLSPLPAPVSGSQLVPAPQTAGSSGPAPVPVPAAPAQPGGDTAPVGSGVVAPVGSSVVGTGVGAVGGVGQVTGGVVDTAVGAVGGVGQVTGGVVGTAVGAVDGVGQVTGGVVDTAVGAVDGVGRVTGGVVDTVAATTPIRTVDSTVVGAIEQLPVPQVQPRTVEPLATGAPSVPVGPERVADTVDDIVRPSTVLDTATSAAHLLR